MARGTPGMSGADLANLVNEAALFAVRRGAKEIERIDFESARDRVLMGARRESLDPHRRGEAGHRLPRGRPRRCWPPCCRTPTRSTRSRSSRPAWPSASPRRCREERHAYSQDYIEDRICMAMGGRVRRGARVRPAHHRRRQRPRGRHRLARRMVREWGMSDRIGPMAWESQGQVFLGEDLMTGQRDYSDDTARVIDEEVERILREQEDRARALLDQAPPRPRPGGQVAARARDDRRLRGRRAGPGGPDARAHPHPLGLTRPPGANSREPNAPIRWPRSASQFA